ncbi:hypothetical protein [uncultured Methanobrevibacter sp.]|uniref:hypothetical protein n=1 Tax=uncultured Methanobrevibacter sp. TaxID=253161 RepID=UPI0025F30BE0|nr:hypothetical protein [uncultured Methanobrevibacter sp.]
MIFMLLAIVVCIATVYAEEIDDDEAIIIGDMYKLNSSVNNTTANHTKTNHTNHTNPTKTKNITNTTSNITNHTTNYTDDKGEVVSRNVSTITVYMMPSVETGLEYKHYTRTWVNYCPFCHKYGTLTDTPKDTSRSNTVPEGEITCDMSLGGCDADFDGVSGKDKLWRDVYLTPADGYQIVEEDDGSFTLENNGLSKKQNIRNAQISILDYDDF